jgi:hypothetical protein
MYQVAALPTSAKSWLLKTITIDQSLIDLQWKSHSQVSHIRVLLKNHVDSPGFRHHASQVKSTYRLLAEHIYI